MGVGGADESARIEAELEKVKLPQTEIPKPKAKMKTLNWNKIPKNKVRLSLIQVIQAFIQVISNGFFFQLWLQ